MATYRCPKHDRIFDSVIDHRSPGAPGTLTLAAHPRDGHPDCPACQVDPTSQPSPAELAKVARARAAQLKAAAEKAQKDADAAIAAAAEAAAANPEDAVVA